MKTGSWRNLQGADRAIARIAHIANVNTVLGGASALVKAERAMAMGLPHASDMLDAVSDVYSRSSGHVPGHLAVVECPECGQWHLGEEAAANCCAPCDDELA